MATTGTFGSATASSRNIGPSGGATNGGFQFTAPNSGSVTSVTMHASTITAAGNFTAGLYTNNSGSPGTQIGSSTPTVNITATGDVTWTFGTPPSITGSTVYWIVISNSSSSDIGFDTVANDANYGSGRNNTITAITTTGLPNTEDWRLQVTYSASLTASVTEAGSASDSPIGGFLISVVATESATAADTSDRGFHITVAATEAAAAADAPTAVAVFLVSVSEASTATDTVFSTLKALAAQMIRKVAPSLTKLRVVQPKLDD